MVGNMLFFCFLNSRSNQSIIPSHLVAGNVTLENDGSITKAGLESKK